MYSPVVLHCIFFSGDFCFCVRFCLPFAHCMRRTYIDWYYDVLLYWVSENARVVWIGHISRSDEPNKNLWTKRQDHPNDYSHSWPNMNAATDSFSRMILFFRSRQQPAASKLSASSQLHTHILKYRFHFQLHRWCTACQRFFFWTSETQFIAFQIKHSGSMTVDIVEVTIYRRY